MELLKALLRQNAKAIAAAVGTGLTGLLLHFGVQLPADVLLAVQGLVLAVIVWLVPNRG